MISRQTTIAPGARIVVRDAEWLVRKVQKTATGDHALTVIGISELVKDKESVFLDSIDTDIEVLNPEDTRLVPDESSAYRRSMLYMESLLRQTPPTDDNLYIGHRAAMDPVPYQLDPAIQALQQPRQRILIADAVGLGKTLACGILMSELIRRGRGKRILVLAVKSILTQFQKEMWSRFTIPLVRLDSIGIQRVRSRIPTNHNPFYYYDKAIISIDTLKQDAEYRTYLENAFWDIIVIDEAHNVAERGKKIALRAKLAKLLSGRSDTLIMLSATPHDGRARSFASLMNMLDPTAIANPEDYGPDDIKGLFIRRFKKDIQDQVSTAFKKRKISRAYCPATATEEDAFQAFTNLTFHKLDQGRSAGQLFKTTLEKALLSSPAACLKTIANRITRLEKEAGTPAGKDIAQLEHLASMLAHITPENFSKYQKLVSVIQDRDHGFGWTGKNRDERLVIFTERIETLHFLYQHLPKDLGLKQSQAAFLHGGMPDVDQQAVVEQFGQENAPVRLLIASDVASEGINLHYLCHHLIHFDIPWSLMVFQQRNGRIDRYGQEKTPFILYLVNQTENLKIKGDMRILEILIKKDDEAVRNIGDPSALMGVYDIDREERITADAMEQGKSDAAFEADLDRTARAAFDPLKILMGETLAPAAPGHDTDEKIKQMPSLYEDDFHYLKDAVDYLKQKESLQAEFVAEKKQVDLTATDDLTYRLRYILPQEVWPEDDTFVLSAVVDDIQEEIRHSRKQDTAWPRLQYLWPQHPVMEWINDKEVAEFGRHEAPVLSLQGALASDEVVFVLSGLVPNLKGHPLVHRWFGVTFHQDAFQGIEPFDSLLTRTGFDRTRFANRSAPVDPGSLKPLLSKAVYQARQYMSQERKRFEDLINPKLQTHLNNLERLKSKHHQQLDLFYTDTRQKDRKAAKKREIDHIFNEFWTWVEETMTTEDHPFIQVIAVLKGVV
jgi:superfamily II DNA or RNA helicase